MSFSDKFASTYKRLLPTPLTIALMLTFLTFILALIFTKPNDVGYWSYTLDLAVKWEEGLWNQGPGGLYFAFQMMMMLVLGHILALSKPVSRLIDQLITPCTNSANTALIVTMATIGVSLLNWGLGLIFGAILARKIGEKFRRENKQLNYPLIGAAAYSGLMVWHGGISGSAPIKAHEEGNLQTLVSGVEGVNVETIPDHIPMTELIFSPMNITVTLMLIILIPLMMYLIGKRRPSEGTLPEIKAVEKTEDGTKPVGAEKLDYSQIFGLVIGMILILYAIYKAIILPVDEFKIGTGLSYWFCLFIGLALLSANTIRKAVGRDPLDLSFYAMGVIKIIGIASLLMGLFMIFFVPNELTLNFLTPNFINFTLLGFCFIFHRSIRNFSSAADDAISGATGILLQFPLYFGILGLMVGSGLIVQISDWFVTVSNETTFPIFTFFSAGLVNVFVPSGGGQWAVQGPILIASVQELGLPYGKAIMALSYGDQLTNMIQPFWALPLLGITGLKAKEILPYTLYLFLGGLVIFIVGLLLF